MSTMLPYHSRLVAMLVVLRADRKSLQKLPPGGGCLNTKTPAPIVRMSSAAMTPVPVLVRSHICIWGRAFWHRCAGILWCRHACVLRLSQGQSRRCGSRDQSANDQSAAHSPNIHARLHVTKDQNPIDANACRRRMRRRSWSPQRVPGEFPIDLARRRRRDGLPRITGPLRRFGSLAAVRHGASFFERLNRFLFRTGRRSTAV